MAKRMGRTRGMFGATGGFAPTRGRRGKVGGKMPRENERGKAMLAPVPSNRVRAPFLKGWGGR